MFIVNLSWPFHRGFDILLKQFLYMFSFSQQTVLQFLNAIITQSPSPNLRVYYQQEIENAGFVADAVEEVFQIF